MKIKRRKRRSTEDAQVRIRRPKYQYTPQLARKICTAIAHGRTMSEVARMPGMPTRARMFRWIDTIPEFSEAFELARQKQALSYAEQTMEIADSTEGDSFLKVQRDGLRVGSRRWFAEFMARRVQQTLSPQDAQKALNLLDLMRLAADADKKEDASTQSAENDEPESE